MTSKPPRPRLADGARITIDPDERGVAAPGLGSHAPVIRTATRKKGRIRRMVRSVAGILIGSAILLVAIYAVLASTVLLVMRAGGENALVLRNAFPEGAAPAGTYVYASSQTINPSFGGRLSQATVGVPAGAVVRIVAGPTGKISNDKKGRIVINGKATDYRVAVKATTLARKYLALCVAGACEPGTAVLIGQDTIVGEVKGYVSPSGLTPTPDDDTTETE